MFLVLILFIQIHYLFKTCITAMSSGKKHDNAIVNLYGNYNVKKRPSLGALLSCHFALPEHTKSQFCYS